jgi:hypothetical protein
LRSRFPGVPSRLRGNIDVPRSRATSFLTHSRKVRPGSPCCFACAVALRAPLSLNSFTQAARPTAGSCAFLSPLPAERWRASLFCAARFGLLSLVSGSLFWAHFEGLLSICSKSSKTFLPTLSTSGPAQAPDNLLPSLLLRWNDLGGYPCRRGDLWPHSGILLTCSGAVCFQNMEVRVLCQGVSGPQWQSRPAGACQRGRRSKDVTTWRWISSIRLAVSLLRSAFRLLYVALRAKQ